jgi:hypothetical protein
MTVIDPPLHDFSAPPSWAQELLTWLVPLSSEESIPGDLLEEYREAVRPSHGPWRANLWYLRQVVGFLCRLTWMFAVFNAAALILRAILDTFAPPGFAPHSYQLRSSASTDAAVITFLLAGCYAGYRMGRANSGTLAAFTASAVGHALALGFRLSWSMPSFGTIPPSSMSSTSLAAGAKPSACLSSSPSLLRR